MLRWDDHLKRTLATFVAVLGALFVFVLGLDPYGNLPSSAFSSHVIRDDNQRFQYPSVVRSGRYDSAVIGTSSSRLLDPRVLDRHLGGRFANLAMNSAMAWEQYRLADLFLRETPAPGTLFVGLDHVWCQADADTNRITPRGFPEWMYDDNRWNDYLYMLNPQAVRIAVQKVGYYLGLDEARLGANGYHEFTPPDSTYDVEMARRRFFWRGPPVNPPFVPSSSDRARWRYPALAWLDEIVGRARVPAATVLLAFTPPHASYLPEEGSREAARFVECKRRIGGMAARHGAHLIDFRIASPLTRDDENFWDSFHYRVRVAARIIRDVARAVDTGRDDPAGEWRYLAGPAKPR